jgi:hypothetical protein
LLIDCACRSTSGSITISRAVGIAKGVVGVDGLRSWLVKTGIDNQIGRARINQQREVLGFSNIERTEPKVLTSDEYNRL